ncbi:MAG: hypothetical protein K5657_06840 [Desulfovibrio sp.]|nr:hypothetical protein [Desulfovibrio sp.]
MAVTITSVCSGLDLERFVSFPWEIYRFNPIWVPSLRADDRALLSVTVHPFWQSARRRLFLASSHGTVLGRIAAIIDDKYNSYAGERCGAFGFFECVDDGAVANALFHAAATWLRSEGMEYMRGPVNPSTNYTCGLLVDGFEERPALMMPWNPPYYTRLFAGFRLHKDQDLFAYRLSSRTLSERPPSYSLKDLLGGTPFTYRTADRARLDEDIACMLGLYRESWARNWYFSPLSNAEEAYLVRELRSIVDTRFFVLFFHGEEAAGGMVALPDFTPLLRKSNGRLSWRTPWHYWQTRQEAKKAYRIILFGIREKFRLLGLPHLLFSYMLGEARKNPSLEWIEGSWVLEENHSICDLIEDFSGEIAMRYRIFRRELV